MGLKGSVPEGDIPSCLAYVGSRVLSDEPLSNKNHLGAAVDWPAMGDALRKIYPPTKALNRGVQDMEIFTVD